MNKKMIITGVAGLLFLGGAFGVSAISNSNQTQTESTTEKKQVISVEEATNQAIKHVGEGVIEEVELDKEDGQIIYEVEVKRPSKDDDVDVDINAKTGQVIKSDRINVGKTENAQAEKSTKKPVKNNVKISAEQAKAIALKDSPGTITEFEFDSDDNEYEIEIRNGNKEIDITINATTGIITEKDIDHDDDFRQSGNVQSVKSDKREKVIQKSEKNNVKISAEQAKAIALKDSPGTITEFEFDSDDNEYEIEIRNGKKEIEITINATTGIITEKDVDYEDD